MTTTVMRRKKPDKTDSLNKRPDGNVPWLTVVGARHNNLRDITVEVPLGRFVCVTGVSGSGKSSLVNDVIWEALARDLNGAINVSPGAHERIEGLGAVEAHSDDPSALDGFDDPSQTLFQNDHPPLPGRLGRFH